MYSSKSCCANCICLRLYLYILVSWFWCKQSVFVFGLWVWMTVSGLVWLSLSYYGHMDLEVIGACLLGAHCCSCSTHAYFTIVRVCIWVHFVYVTGNHIFLTGLTYPFPSSCSIDHPTHPLRNTINCWFVRTSYKHLMYRICPVSMYWLRTIEWVKQIKIWHQISVWLVRYFLLDLPEFVCG